MIDSDISLSFVIPVKDEEATLKELAESIRAAVEEIPETAGKWEIIFVDDGSQDRTWARVRELADGRIRGIQLRRNCGKATALEAGFREARGEIVFTMDADLQDDPKEIPNFLAKLDEGFDLVSGWKRRRHDPLSKTLPSRLFNKVTAAMTGVRLHDFNCGFKCYRREVIESVHLYGELHRFIPVLAYDLGFTVGEIEVEHHPRKSGVSKYGWERYLRGLIDLVTVIATTRWLNKPGHLFGTIGLLIGFVGGAILLYMVGLWFAGFRPIGDRPLLLFGVLFCILSVQMISLGIIAEFLVRVRDPGQINAFIRRKTGTSKVAQEE
jgi:glycosyltransferase involved in cell wall biosynthesis